jgi:hypothetical protein
MIREINMSFSRDEGCGGGAFTKKKPRQDKTRYAAAHRQKPKHTDTHSTQTRHIDRQTRTQTCRHTHT